MRINKRPTEYKRKKTEHHKIPKSVWGTWCEENKIDWRLCEHKWHHDKFWVKIFHDQIIQILDENKTILLPESIDLFRKLIKDMTTLLIEEKMYKKKVFKYNTMPKSI